MADRTILAIAYLFLVIVVALNLDASRDRQCLVLEAEAIQLVQSGDEIDANAINEILRDVC